MVFPFGLSGRPIPTINKIMVGLFETIALYNISIDKNQITKDDIFRNNMIAWNVSFGVILAVDFFTKKKEKNDIKESNFAFRFKPVKNGGQLSFKYNNKINHDSFPLFLLTYSVIGI
ncbi:MAG: hypothetical protein ACC657_09945 [Thiohalomonadales bacterium]